MLNHLLALDAVDVRYFFGSVVGRIRGHLLFTGDYFAVVAEEGEIDFVLTDVTGVVGNRIEIRK